MVFLCEFLLRKDGILIRWDTLSSEEFNLIKTELVNYMEANDWKTNVAGYNFTRCGKMNYTHVFDIMAHLNKQYTLGDFTIELVSSRIAKKIYKENP